MGRETAREQRSREVFETNRRILWRVRDASDRFLMAVARTAEVDVTERGVQVMLPADEWTRFAAESFGADHPVAREIAEKVRAAEVLHGLRAPTR